MTGDEYRIASGTIRFCGSVQAASGAESAPVTMRYYSGGSWVLATSSFTYADAAADARYRQLLQSAAALYGGVPAAPEYCPGSLVEVE